MKFLPFVVGLFAIVHGDDTAENATEAATEESAGCSPTGGVNGYLRWRFFDGFYPTGDITQADLDGMLVASADFFLSAAQYYESAGLGLAESNITDLTMCTDVADCTFPEGNSTEPSFWCRVGFDFVTTGEEVTFERIVNTTIAYPEIPEDYPYSPANQPIQEYIIAFLWRLGDPAGSTMWYNVNEHELCSAFPCVARSDGGIENLGSVTRSLPESDEPEASSEPVADSAGSIARMFVLPSVALMMACAWLL